MKKKERKISVFHPVLTETNDETFHSHPYFEIFYITTGSITHLYSTKHDKLTVGDAFLICPGQMHNFKRTGPCSHRDVLLGCDLVKNACDYLSPDLYESLLNKHYVRFSLSTESILFLEKSFSNYLKSGDTISREHYEKGIVATLISLLCFSPDAKDENPSNFRDKCIYLLNFYFTCPDALQIIRNKLGYNDVYLTRKFKKYFNCTPTAYITNLRLEHAVYLLSVSNYTLEECCSNIGIYSVPYFINVFKKKYGMTPSKYMKQIKNK